MTDDDVPSAIRWSGESGNPWPLSESGLATAAVSPLFADPRGGNASAGTSSSNRSLVASSTLPVGVAGQQRAEPLAERFPPAGGRRVSARACTWSHCWPARNRASRNSSFTASS